MEEVHYHAEAVLGFQIDTVYSGVSNTLDASHRCLHRRNQHEYNITQFFDKYHPDVDIGDIKKQLCLVMMKAVGPLGRLLEHVCRRIYENLGMRVMKDKENMIPSEGINYHYSFDNILFLYVNIFPKPMADMMDGHDGIDSNYHRQSFKPYDGSRSFKD